MAQYCITVRCYHGGIIWKNGVCQHQNYNNYHVLRINETPPIDDHIVESGEAPDGVGESGLPPVATALGNAIFAATGFRFRNLPIEINNLTDHDARWMAGKILGIFEPGVY